MGLGISSDTLIEDLNSIGDTSRQSRFLGRLSRRIEQPLLFLGLWSANTNTPELSTMTPSEGSFMKVIDASDSSILGSCKSTDWILYSDSQWVLVSLSLEEVVSNILTFTAPNSVRVARSSAISDGYLSSSDWVTFNNKQSHLGNGLTFLDSPSNSSTSIMSSRAIQLLLSQIIMQATVGDRKANALWDPTINRPEIRDGAGVVGYNYYVKYTASVDIGNGVRTFNQGQIISYVGATREWK